MNALTLLLALPGAFFGQSNTAHAAERVDFLRDVQPLLEAHCLKCHGKEKQKGGLRLDSKAEAFKGGDSGERGVVAGRAGESHLIHAVTSQDPEEQMPPRKGGNKPLDAAQIGLLKRWIDDGAEWTDSPETAAASARSEMKVTDADRQHWSFLPQRDVVPPISADKSWGRTAMDQFIRHSQEARALSPSPAADTRTLVRRVYFDIIGLPPTPEEMARWTERVGASLDTFGELVDELLASPHYGERWARHWLDVARYADSNGMEADKDRPNAYRFRDFVIRALNEDMPYEQFVRWQLAGDELAPDNPEAIAATGFLVAGVSSDVNPQLLKEETLRNRANELDDMVSTTSQAMLGLTMACARCHDHKYDPLPTRDYYRLMRIFNSGERRDVPFASSSEVKSQTGALAAWKEESVAAETKRDEWLKQASKPVAEKLRNSRIAALKISDEEKRLLTEMREVPAAKALAERFKKELKIADDDYVAALGPNEQAQWKDLDDRVKAIAKRKPDALAKAFAFADSGPEPQESWFFERGDFMARKERMDLGFLTVLTSVKTAADYWKTARDAKLRDDSTQQRRALADWMTDRERGAGTLLARVLVNRVWQHHFGTGLVRTSGDFGVRGELPTHPELLEWLTGEFVRSGWSMKHLHRLIVNSATYQQGTAFDEKKNAIDPENRLLWRRRPMRLESEALRDSMLAVAGSLNPAVYGPSFKPPIPAEALQARNVKDPYPGDAKETPETMRRTIYMFHKRVVQYPLMQAFDAPDAQQSCSGRMNTTVAPQALALLNDPFVRTRAAELAKRLNTEAAGALADQIRLAFQRCLNREPTTGEFVDARDFINKQSASRTQTNPANAQPLALTDFCQSLFGLNEFIYID